MIGNVFISGLLGLLLGVEHGRGPPGRPHLLLLGDNFRCSVVLVTSVTAVVVMVTFRCHEQLLLL